MEYGLSGSGAPEDSVVSAIEVDYGSLVPDPRGPEAWAAVKLTYTSGARWEFVTTRAKANELMHKFREREM